MACISGERPPNIILGAIQMRAIRVIKNPTITSSLDSLSPLRTASAVSPLLLILLYDVYFEKFKSKSPQKSRLSKSHHLFEVKSHRNWTNVFSPLTVMPFLSPFFLRTTIFNRSRPASHAFSTRTHLLKPSSSLSPFLDAGVNSGLQEFHLVAPSRINIIKKCMILLVLNI